jgi:hypothetical protein
MNYYYSLQSLSVVAHNQMLTQRMNPKTEATRLKALACLSVEMTARRDYQIKETMLNRKAIVRASAKSNKALQSFFKAKDKDNAYAPIFWVKG